MLAARGTTVVVSDIDLTKAQRVAEEIGGLAIRCDVTKSHEVDAAVDKAVATYGRLDVMINNAGIAPPPNPDRFERAVANQMSRFDPTITPLPLDVLTAMDDDQWDTMIRIHLYGTFYGTRAALRHMTPHRRGSVINISSILGLKPSPMAPHYSTAKAGIIALTKSVASETAQFGLRVNAVCPGWADTPLLEPMSDQMRAVIVSQIGMGRLATSNEIAELVCFLASPASSYCTGEVFSASGGYAS
jgi:NAD(P)-dependent dehydrogenase (short-subunit alcohol dehydrogenase family)